MLSDEEKKDILFQIDMQLYDEFNDKFCEMNDNLGTIYTYKDIDDLEKLEKETEIKLLRKAIEKQSKEIEELKENNKNLEDELNKYIVKMSDEQYRRLVDIIRDEINKLWEDKIKAKIEEIEKRRLQDGECELALHGFQREAKIEVLQSLLEKE